MPDELMTSNAANLGGHAVVGTICVAFGAFMGKVLQFVTNRRQQAIDEARFSAMELRLTTAEAAVQRCHDREITAVIRDARHEARIEHLESMAAAKDKRLAYLETMLKSCPSLANSGGCQGGNDAAKK